MSRNFLFLTDDEILAGGWRNEFALADDWTLVGDISYSNATRDQKQYETNAGIPGTNGQKFTYDNGSFRLRRLAWPSLTFGRNYADPNLVKLGAAHYGSGWSKKPSVEDELMSLRADAIRDAELWWFDATSFGVNYSDRTKDKVGQEGPINTINGGYVTVTNPLRSANLSYANAGRILAWNVASALRDYYKPIEYLTADTTPWLVSKTWDVEEKVWTGYVRGDLGHDISDTVTLKGNVGVQVLYTDQSSTAYSAENPYTPQQAIVSRTEGTSYTDILPQVNLAFMLQDDQAVRFGVARDTGPRPHGSAQGQPGGRLRDEWHPRRQRRQPRARPVACMVVRRVLREVLRGHEGLCVSGGLLQGPEQLHLRADRPES